MLQLLLSCWECNVICLQVMLQMARAHLLAAQQAPVPKQPADPAAIPPPNKNKSVRTAPNTKQNPNDMETPDILESGGGKGRGRGEARGPRGGATSGKGKGTGRGTGRGRGRGKSACNAAESATDADLLAQVMWILC